MAPITLSFAMVAAAMNHPAAPQSPQPPASSRRCLPPRLAEKVLLLVVVALTLLALRLPAIALPAGYHDFAGRRGWMLLPYALDVLSNGAFVVVGLLGWRALRRMPEGCIGWVQRELAGLFMGGLVLVALGSAFYHWGPGDASLGIDRLAMSPAFASLLGLAVADRISARAGLAMAGFVALAAPAAALAGVASGNMTPWTVLQVGGLVLLAVLAPLAPRRGALGIALLAVLAGYGAAKMLELGDASVLAWTGGLVSGHSLKHGVVALAAWPVVHALRRLGSQAQPAARRFALRGGQ